MKAKLHPILATATGLALLAGACAPAATETPTTAPTQMAATQTPATEPMPEPTHTHETVPTEVPAATEIGAVETSNTAAADLRKLLNLLLSEHAVLASQATGAALGGRTAEFEAAAAALDENSVELSQAVGSVYGPEAEEAFLDLWRAHIGFFVDYTNGVAMDDQAMQDKAVDDLIGYTQDFGAFLNSANPNLPKETVAELVQEHVLSLKAVVDAQAAGDQPGAYTAVREAYHHMAMIADPLAGAIVAQFPDKFDETATDTSAADLRTTLNLLLAEHVTLASGATGGALGGRTDEFEAAAAALDANTVELSQAIGSVYGPEAGEAFLPLWRAHIGFFVDYTNGVAMDDQAMQDKAVDDLIGYTEDFGAFLNSANPNLPKETVAELVQEHVLTLKDVVDAQAAGNAAQAFEAQRHAFGHMAMIADPLAESIVVQFPEMFQ
jgi:hypothetical protein